MTFEAVIRAPIATRFELCALPLDKLNAPVLRASLFGPIVGNRAFLTDAYRLQPALTDTASDDRIDHRSGASLGQRLVRCRRAGVVGIPSTPTRRLVRFISIFTTSSISVVNARVLPTGSGQSCSARPVRMPPRHMCTQRSVLRVLESDCLIFFVPGPFLIAAT